MTNRVRPTKRFRRRPRRKGAIVVLAALLMVLMVAMLAFSIDSGYIASCRTDIQRSVDAGAFAGAGVLAEGIVVADQAAREYTRYNRVGNSEIENGLIDVEFGQWDDASRSFTPNADEPSAVRVLAREGNQPFFFGRVFGHNTFDISAEAIATYRPRDIMVVLDYSASMNDDSELRHIGKLGRRAIEQNLFQIYRELGSPTFGTMQWQPVSVPSRNNAVIKATLGLDKIPYPYPSGSWDDYINYVKSSNYLSSAGYRNKYGYLTLVNYWLERKPRYSQTPDLWQTSEQPITAVKDAVQVFLSYMQAVETLDQVGLSVYTAPNGGGKLEVPLTRDYQQIEDVSRQRQAGHYDNFTNISAGLREARLELEKKGRAGALRMIVLMTDGIANRPSNPTVAKREVLKEARLAADSKFPVVTISLGAGADKALMQQVADITGGVHFNIPGGQSVAAYEEDLKEVFKQIADDRPLRLVH
ncbi:MAG: VWA domain-containing protein [Planctomycetota bacterium]|nr:MAG: VWA domain-containing protein [Planctomycetota bacterium]REJ86654.1 MAG: VWA domain-containing protein [Planctomycetota bacterium]